MSNLSVRSKLAILLYLRRKYRKEEEEMNKRRSRFWVRDIFKKRHGLGASNTLIAEMRLGDHSKYYNYLRMSPINFDILLSKISHKLLKCAIYRKPIEPSEMLAVTLRYLASGDSMVSISYAFRLGTATVSNIIASTCQAIWEVLQKEVFPDINEANWLNIADGFNNSWNLPHCIGAIDGKHVVIEVKAPPNSGSQFFNYKGAFSIVLMALCDSQYNFIYVDIGAAGRQSDGGVLRNSKLGQRLFSKNLNIPPPVPLLEGELPVTYYIVGDEAFPLMPNLMRPYPGRYLEVNKKIFNYRLSRARRVVENAFGILASKWRIFRKPIIAKIETVEKIIQASVCLHNFLNKMDNNYISKAAVDLEDAMGNVTGASWRKEATNNLINVTHVGGNNYGENAATIRDYLKEFVVYEDPIPPQWNL